MVRLLQRQANTSQNRRERVIIRNIGADFFRVVGVVVVVGISTSFPRSPGARNDFPPNFTRHGSQQYPRVPCNNIRHPFEWRYYDGATAVALCAAGVHQVQHTFE